MLKGLARQLSILVVHRRYDLKIVDERAQLGGRAQLQFSAGIQIERFVEAVGMNADQISSFAALVQHHAIGHFCGVAAAQQVLSDKAKLFDPVRVAQLRQKIGDPMLRGEVESGGSRKIEMIEVV